MNMIPLQSIAQLVPGTIIRHLTASKAMVVTANYGDHAVAVSTMHVSNPSEWLISVEDPVASTQVAQSVPLEAGDGPLTPEQRADFIQATNGPTVSQAQWEDAGGELDEPEEEPLRVSGEIPEGFEPHSHL